MASPGDNNEGGHQNEKYIYIDEMKVFQSGEDCVITSYKLGPDNAPTIDVQKQEGADGSQNSVDLNVTVGSAEMVQTGDTNLLVMNNTPQKRLQQYSHEIKTCDNNHDIEVDGKLPSLSPCKADKSTDTSIDGVHARGYRMGVADRLHFCYLQGPDFVQIANCCTYIEIDINEELVQDIRSQGCLKAEVANGQSLVTFKWGSLEREREYIRCELKTELLPKLLDNYKCLEKNILESLLRNCDDNVELILEYFLRKHEASLLEIVEGCMVFMVLVPDVEAKDRLFSQDSLTSIAKFLEDLLITDTVREKAGRHQVSFKVTPLGDWSNTRPHDKHIFRFNTNVARDSSPALTEASLRQLIQSIVSQEIQAGLSKVQVDLADTVARAVSAEIKKVQISEQEMLTLKLRTGDISQDDLSQELESSSLSSSNVRLESLSLAPSSLRPESSSQFSPPGLRSGSSSQSHPNLGPDSSSRSPPGFEPGSSTRSPPGLEPGSSSRSPPGLGPGSSSRSPPGLGPGSSSRSPPSLGPGSSSQSPPSLGPGSSFQSSHDLGLGSSSQSPVLGLGTSFRSSPSPGPGNSSKQQWDSSSPLFHFRRPKSPVSPHQDPARTINERDPCRDHLQHTGMKPSVASILFDQHDGDHVWPDHSDKAAAAKISHSKGSFEPLNEDILMAVQCVRGMVDIERLAKLKFKPDTCTGETSELSQAPGLNTILCLDVSNSMKNEPLEKLVECVKQLREEIEDNTDIALEENVGVVLFGGDVRIKLLPTNDYQQLEDAVTNLTAGGDTSPLLEALLTSILLLFETDNDPYFTIGEHYRYPVCPRIILMSDGMTTEGRQTEGTDYISEEVSDAVCKFLPMILKASRNKCSINCVQFGDKSENCSMMENLSLETRGDVVDPSQIQWLSHYFRRQNAVGKIMDWLALPENKEASESNIMERIQAELSYCKTEDLREQDQVKEEVSNYRKKSESRDYTCQSASAIESQEPDFLSTGRHPVFKPGDKIRKETMTWCYNVWNDRHHTDVSTCEIGTVISYNQRENTVKVKLTNGTEDYFQACEVQLVEGTEQQEKPSEVLNVEERDDDLQVDCDLGSEPGDLDPSSVETDVSQGQHNMPSLPSGVGTVACWPSRDSNHKIVWQRKEKGDNWITYSQEQIDVIEKAYTSHSKSCVISSPNKLTRYHLDFSNLQSTKLSDMTSSDIRRSEMTYNEYAQRIENLQS